MRITFLGTGTSVGIPVIGCDCAVCRSADPRNPRRRSSLCVEADGLHLVVDTPPDFREQVLACGIPKVDAVLFTHSHADHIFGFDDIRRFNTLQDAVIPAFGSAETVADLKRIFNYICLEPVKGLYRPRIEFHAVSGPFAIASVEVTPLPVEHGDGETFGYRLDAGGRSLGYVPDCSRMPDAVVSRLRGVDVMILDALRHRPHRTHLTVAQSLSLVERIDARSSFLVHMCHDLDHAETEKALPEGVLLPQDGLVVEW